MTANESKCAICTEPLGNWAVTIDCGHQYDLACIKSWVKLNNVCPVCKTPVTKFLRHGNVLCDVHEPRTTFSLLMDDHVFGNRGRARREHTPWRHQPDLDGFVFDDVSLSEQRSFEELDESDVSEVELQPIDHEPISARTRRRHK